MRRLVLTGTQRAVAAVLLAAVLVLAATSVIIGANHVPTKGAIPAAAFPAGGQMDLGVMPDFVPALNREGGPAGYVAKGDLGSVDSTAVPVYSDDLQTVVGHMVPGRGFVPLGADAAAVRPFLVVQAPAGK